MRCTARETPIRLERKQALTIDGNGARLLRTEPGDPDESKTRTNASLDLYSGFDIVIKNLEIYGAHDRRPPQYRRDFEAQHGIDVAGVVSLVICHNQIVNVLGDFVYFGASGTARTATGRRRRTSTSTRTPSTTQGGRASPSSRAPTSRCATTGSRRWPARHSTSSP